NARITESSAERSTLAGMRMMFATVAGFTVTMLTQPLAAMVHGRPAAGFTLAAAVFALLATVIFPVVFLTVREPQERDPQPQLGVRDHWRAVLGNRAFWVVMAGISLAVICSTALGKSVLYYFKYYLKDEAAARIALSINAAAGLVIIPVWIAVTRKVGKRAAWLISTVWGLAGLVVFALVDIRSPALMMGFLLYMQVAALGAAMTFWSMLPDTVEYGEWRTGDRAEAFIFGLGQFFLKVALGLGAGLFGWALGAVGYVPNRPQTAETLAGLKTIMVVLPMIGTAGAGLAMLFYPLRGGDHERIVRELEARPSRAAKGTAGPVSRPAVGEEVYET
ncbi:MAG TPA: MFS transporter, partial [Phenylobacterium sp.]|nr:MFS transporter [Phenylobacterium sp.]